MKMLTIIIMVLLFFAAAVVNAGAYTDYFFGEDFENPTGPTAYSQGTLPDGGNWVGATAGYRANWHGLNDKAGGDFTAPAGNDQAYSFRYTNSGLTTAEGVIGPMEAVAYTVSFDVAADMKVAMDPPVSPGTGYGVVLMTFDPGEIRYDVRPDYHAGPFTYPDGTTLAYIQGNATTDGSWTHVSFIFDADMLNPNLGKDLAIRLDGATNNAVIDNVSLFSVVPELPPGMVQIMSVLFGGFGALGFRAGGWRKK